MKALFFRGAILTVAAFCVLHAQHLPVPPGSDTADITYHGGPILTQPVRVYLLWYGNWTNDTSTIIVPFFVRNLTPSPYWGTLASYSQGSGADLTYAKNDVILAGQTFTTAANPYPLGKSLSDSNVWTFVQDSFKGTGVTGKLPADQTAVYIVLASQGVAETSGFGTKYCGFHIAQSLSNGPVIKYIFVGEPTRAQAGTCAPNGISRSPNNNWQADAMVNIIAGKLADTISDPLMNAWYDRTGSEMSTKCAWNFGGTETTNGATWNVTLGGSHFLVQELWVPGLLQACSLGY
jgi:hypothetical protein